MKPCSVAGWRHDPAYTVAFPACMNPTNDICFTGMPGSCIASTVHADHLAGDVTRAFGDQERTGVSDILCRSGTADRGELRIFLHGPTEEASPFGFAEHRRVDETRGMVLTVIPLGPSSSASALVKPISPAFDVT